MCIIKPLTVKKISGKTVEVEGGIKAYYDKKIGKLAIGDKVLVYGNLVLNKTK